MNELLTQIFQYTGKTIFVVSVSAFYGSILVIILKGLFYKPKNK